MDLAGLLEEFEASFAPALESAAFDGFADLPIFTPFWVPLPLVQMDHTLQVGSDTSGPKAIGYRLGASRGPL